MRNIIKIVYCIILLFGFTSLYGQSKKIVEKEIVLKTETGNLVGKIVTPKKKGSDKIVLIIAGSGPTDMDGGNNMGMKTNCYKQIAEELALNNISSIRFDKRGIAKSISAAPKTENEMSFEVMVNDVVDWISLIEKDKRFKNIYIMGHSEGSLIGILAAQKKNVKGFISLAGTGRSIEIVLKEQLANQLKGDSLILCNAILDSLKLQKAYKNPPSYLNALLRESIQPYLMSWFKYDPAVELAKLNFPSLIIQGENDIQVSLVDYQKLSEVDSKNTSKLIKEMNHVLKDAPKDRNANILTYYDPNLKLSKELMPTIISYILK